MTIKELQSETDQWIKEIGVRYFNVSTNALLLQEELGEFSRLIARKYGEQSFKRKEDEENVSAQIADEMADMIFVITCLANQMDIDLTEAIAKNFQKKTQRDSTRHKENPKL